MTSAERHELRFQRRCNKRLLRKQERSNSIGEIEDVFSYDKLYKAGKKCCAGVRWKQSVQRFEIHLFSKTAINTRLIKTGKWNPRKYTSFLLKERGKIRPIDAPAIQDRQIHKVFTKNVLLPLYLPDMIWNNGASLEGKGFSFSHKMLCKDLRSFFKHYGTEGKVILLDFKQFFPSVPHECIYQRHKKILLNYDLRLIGDKIVSSNNKQVGMPLGVEPSQVEMVAFPSPLDNYIKCQLSMKYAGHYMDDYYILVPPDMDAKEILSLIVKKATDIGLTINLNKTKILPFCKPLKHCKVKYSLTSNGKVVTRGNRDSVKRARRKIKVFVRKICHNEMSCEDLRDSLNGVLAYFSLYNDHNRILQTKRLLYSVFRANDVQNIVKAKNNNPKLNLTHN